MHPTAPQGQTAVSGGAVCGGAVCGMARRCGPSCSPRSGAALSWSTGLRMSHFISTIAPAIRSPLWINVFPTLLLMVAISVLLVSTMAMPTDYTPMLCSDGSNGSNAVFLHNASSCWLGYDFDASLGYPGEGPPVELEKPVEVENDAMNVWLQQLEHEKLAIEVLPFVKQVDFFCDAHSQNLNKVMATVWCCWDPSRRSFTRVFENCDQSGKKPTHLEAARALHSKLIDSKHARSDHVFDQRAVNRREELMRQQGAETTDAETAFDRIRLAQARQQSAARQASAAEQAAEAARETEAAARPGEVLVYYVVATHTQLGWYRYS